MKYRVFMDFEGMIKFDVQARSKEEAEDKAMKMFKDMDGREIVANIIDIEVSTYTN